MRKAKQELVYIECDLEADADTTAIANTGGTDNNLNDFLAGDLLYTVDPAMHIQTANGIAECGTRIRRYSPALNEFCGRVSH